MHKDEVPQDVAPTYEGLRKLLYAVDERGQYTGVPSSGWEAESFATVTAVAELDRLRDAAWQRVRAGEASTLEYHMYNRRMELDTLSMVTGLWRWRIRRHCKPQYFSRLSASVLTRYANALGITVEQLRHLPATPGAV